MARYWQRQLLLAALVIGIAQDVAGLRSPPQCPQLPVPITDAKCKAPTCKTVTSTTRYCPTNHRCDESLRAETIHPRTGCKTTVCLRGGLVTAEKQWPPFLGCENGYWCSNGQCIGSNPTTTCAIPEDEVTTCATSPKLTTDCPSGKDCDVSEVVNVAHAVSGRPIYSCRTANYKLNARVKGEWIPVEYIDCNSGKNGGVWRLQSTEELPATEKLEITCVSSCPQKPSCANWNTKCATHASCVDASTGPECRCDANFIDTSKDHGKPAASVCQPCKRVALDVVFVLDTSESVEAVNNEKIKTYVQDFIGSFKVGKDDVRFAVSQYPTKKDTALRAYPRIEFNDFVDIKLLQEAVRMRVNYTEAWTCTSHAMEFSHEHFFGKYYQADPMRQKVMIVVTDGNPFCPDNLIKEGDSDARIKSISKKIHDDGVAIFAVGVGDVDKQTLAIITGQAMHSIYVDDFTKLALHQSVSDLQKIVCISPPPPPPTVKCSDQCHQSAKCVVASDNSGYECRCLDGYRDASSEHRKNPGTVCQKCEHSGLDILFVLDTSGSVYAAGVKKMKEYVIEFMSQFKIGTGSSDTRFAASYFPSKLEKEAKFGFDFNEFTNLARLQQGVRDRVIYTEAYTCQSKWMQESYDRFFGKSYDGNSKGRTKVMIIITDGEPYCPRSYMPGGDNEANIELVSNFIRSKGVALYALGVGAVKQHVLDIVSGKYANTLHVKDMDALKMRTSLDKLQKLVCGAEVVQPPKPNPPGHGGKFSQKCSDKCKPLLDASLSCKPGEKCDPADIRDTHHYDTGCRITNCNKGWLHAKHKNATASDYFDFAYLFCNEDGLWCDARHGCFAADAQVTCTVPQNGCSSCRRPRTAWHCKPGIKCHDNELYATENPANGCQMWKCNPGFTMIVLTGHGYVTATDYSECLGTINRLGGADFHYNWEVTCIESGVPTCASSDAPKCDANAKCVDTSVGAECRCTPGFVDSALTGQAPGSICRQCDIAALDILFILDTSGSIGDDNTNKMKTFIVDLISLFKMDGSEEASRFAFAQSAAPNGKTALFRIGFTDYGDYDSLGTGIHRKITATKGATCTSHDIEQSYERYFGDNYITLGKRQKVVVVFTDGEPDCPLGDTVQRIETTCNKIRSEGVAVYAVGIGNVKKDTLKKIAGGDDKVFYVDDFSKLLYRRSVSELQQLVCKTVPAPNREKTCKETACADNAECVDTTNGPVCRCVQGFVDVSAEKNLTAGSVCQVCTKNVLDVAFVLDTSGSVGEQNTKLMKAFVNDFVSLFKMGFGQSRFGLSQSASANENSALFRIEINAFINTEKWKEALEQRVTYTAGSTCTSYDMEQSYQHFFESNQLNDPNRKKVMVVITDGEPACQYADDSVDRIERVAGEIRDKGVTLIAIGIGAVRQETLDKIAGRNAIHLDDFNKLQVREYLDQVHNKVCTASRITTCSQLQCGANTTCVDTPQGGDCRCADGFADYSDAGQKPGSVCKECQRTGLDIAFMLDTSGSVGAENTEKMKHFVSDFIRRFRVGFGGTRFALAQSPATGNNTAYFRFVLNEVIQHDAYAKLISDRVTFSGGGACTSFDIAQTHQHFFVDKYPAAANRQKVLIVITDGEPDCAYPGKDSVAKIESVCNDIRKKDVQIFAVGIGNVKMDTLDKIAGGSGSTYFDNFNALDAAASVAKLQTVVCSTSGTGGSTNVKTCKDIDCADNSTCEEQPTGAVCRCVAGFRESNGVCEECAKIGLDIVFTLDTSGSVGDYNTQRMKHFVTDFISQFRVGFGGTRFALSQSPKNGDKQAYMHFKLNDFVNATLLKEAVNSKVYFSGGWTCTSHDMEQTYEEFYVKTYPNIPNRKKIMIVVTDGEPDCRYAGGDSVARCKKVADDLRSKGITIIAVGVGNVKKSTLETIAGGDQTLYVDNFENLELRKSVLGLQKIVCDQS